MKFPLAIFFLVLAALPFSTRRGAQAQTLQIAAADLPNAPQPSSIGQTTSPPSSSSSSSQTTPSIKQGGTPAPGAPPQSGEDAVKAAEKQRLLGVVPAFNTVESGTAPPLTPKGKFELWYKASIDPFTFVTAGLTAGYEQAVNSYPEYHQGFEGFAKRYGAGYADTVDGNFWGNAVLPVLLRQDPRYFRLGHGTNKQRLWYSVLSTVRCRGDNGKWQPNYSNIGGNLIGGGISNLYYPASDRGIGLTFERGFTVTAEGAIGSLIFEFYPDVVAHYKRRHAQDANAATTTPATQR